MCFRQSKLFSSVLFLLSIICHAQTTISGTVTDENGQPIMGANILVKDTQKGTSTDFDGKFILKLPLNKKTLIFSGVGLESKELKVDALSDSKPIVVRLRYESTQLDAIELVGESKPTRIVKKGFSVAAIETQKIKSQSLEINQVLARAPGVQVRTSGGTGSDFDYSLNGMSGNAIRFFVDGIPMNYFGASYSINNIPISLIDRIDIYKGVVPIELGSDALGGAINLVTNQSTSNFLEASYAYGSFNTHKAAVHGQWRNPSGFTSRLSAYYTYSDNNYGVWGRGVVYGEEGTGKVVEFTEDNPAERFNDDFKTTTAKVDLGFTEKPWADKFFVSLLASDLEKGVQTGQTMGQVYGEIRNTEKVLMPSVNYQKKNVLTPGLSVSAFAAYSNIKATVIDTTTNRYDWRGEIIGTNPSGGEIGRNGRSLYTQKDKSQVYRLNTTYALPADFKLGFNFLYSYTKRTGDDLFESLLRIAFVAPQNIGATFGGLSLETAKFNNRLQANAFLKYYGFHATINDLVYTTEYEIIENKSDISNWGGGFAASFKISPQLLIKSSVEQATRLPSPTEAFGNGITITNNPNIKPEESFNANLGLILGRYDLGDRHGLKIALGTFYRDITNRIQLDVQGEIGQFQNIDKISGAGAEMDIIYDFAQKLKFNLNATYNNLKNNLKVDESGRDNIYYGDRLKNEPYFTANAGLEYTWLDLIQKEAKTFVYLQSGYKHKFFLNWESLGSEENKNTIPSQLVFDLGIGYTFPSKKLNAALDVSNLLNEQVYDNFLLQKPGRAIALKVTYKITD